MQLFFTALYLLLYGIATSAVLGKISKGKLTVQETLLAGFGVGPVLIPAVLYAFYTLLPGTPPWICLSVITLLPLGFLSFSWRTAGELVCESAGMLKTFRQNSRKTFVTTAILFPIAFLIGCAACVVIPQMNFDFVEYATLGQHFAAERQIVYNGVLFFEETGFYFRSFHSFLYPLFGSFGYHLSGITGGSFVGTLKFLHYYYFLLLNLLFLLALFRCCPGKLKENLLLFFILNLTGFTVYSLTAFGIDFFRVYFLFASFLLLYRYLKKPDYFTLALLGIMTAIAANAHIFGAILVPLIVCCTFFARGSFKQNVFRTFLLGTGVILLGYFHYFLMLFWGDGWIFSTPAIEISAEDMVSRGFVNDFDYVFKGYLGQFFRLDYFGIFLVGILPVLYILFRDRKKYDLQDKAFFTVYLISCVIVGYFFYNFRYAYSLYPLTTLLLYVILQKQAYAFWSKALVCVLVCNILISFSSLYNMLYHAMTMMLQSSVSGNSAVDTANFAKRLQQDEQAALNLQIKQELPNAKRGIALVHNKILNQRYPDLCLVFYSPWEKYIYDRQIMECMKMSPADVEKYLLDNFNYAVVQYEYVPKDDQLLQFVKKNGKLVISTQLYEVYQIGQKGK